MHRPVLTALPAAAGTYVLLLRLDRATTLTVGRLGTHSFPAGHYAYVGSAFGNGGLRARVGRHLRTCKTQRWHIDYLRAAGSLREVWYALTAPGRERDWVDLLSGWPELRAPVSGFGASDSDQDSHLLFCPRPLSFAKFRRQARECWWAEQVLRSALQIKLVQPSADYYATNSPFNSPT